MRAIASIGEYGTLFEVVEGKLVNYVWHFPSGKGNDWEPTVVSGSTVKAAVRAAKLAWDNLPVIMFPDCLPTTPELHQDQRCEAVIRQLRDELRELRSAELVQLV